MRQFTEYRPITAAPFRCDDHYIEIEPCAALRPYIRCFWGSRDVKTRRSAPCSGRTDIVVPDTCMDIVFHINDSEHTVCADFCGIDDKFYKGGAGGGATRFSQFGIRFYAWSAVLFSEESMEACRNARVDAEIYFPGLVREISQPLCELQTIGERVRLAEEALLRRVNLRQENTLFMEAVAEIIRTSGTLKTTELAKAVFVSGRQLERVFKENAGVSPKQLSSLVRYQRLWHDILMKPGRQIQDEVYILGYTDQAHLVHEFKRYHGMTIKEARAWAMEHVAFLQDGA